jgi:hypothetical protein
LVRRVPVDLPFKMFCGCCGKTFNCSGGGYCGRKVNCVESVKTGTCVCPACFHEAICYSKADFREYYRLYRTCWGIPKSVVPLLFGSYDL